MNKNLRGIDKVRASRDGHEFHEAWAARKALQLVMPTDGLVGIAIEGLAPADQASASAETVEIADLVLYYGRRPTFDGAHSVVIVQVKYSKRSQSVPYRASDAKKTIRKFASAFRSHRKKHGAKNVAKKISFELITNRPISRGFAAAIDGLASGVLLKEDAKKQATQFVSASGLTGKELVQFAQKVRITGLAGSLRQNKQHLSRVLADWSVAPDAMARARLGGMRQLLREKAGLAGDRQNVITRTDVLDALELQSPADLFPCPANFSQVGQIVEREQLSAVVRLIPKLDKPLLIHAAGGVGKTVFLQSLSKALSESHKTVLFDCFGGGAYRAPDDARHLPQRGLVHIINGLSCDGLCDPLLPSNENVEVLVKAFRVRLEQAVATLRRGSRAQQLFLFIDAIDSAAEHAKDKGEKAFPRLLLESFHHRGLIAGVQLIVSCRTHRREISRGDIPCEEFELNPFSVAEAQKYLRDRIPTVTDTQMQVAYSRSGGNPRILEHLALSDRGLLDPSEIQNEIKLDDLLKARIKKALTEALKRGYKKPDIDAFLAGLSVLPPPVPLNEYADAHGMDLSAVQSFAADLAPLLEHTKHGLMFRDEPTETLIREVYAAKPGTLSSLAQNLYKKQGVSVYAARALPGLLQKLDDGKLLFDLAFDDRFPSAITSTVGKQNIRYARLKAAVLHAARKKDFDRLIHLLVELSTLAAANQRGTDYVLDNPDLVIASHDIDATRRLFETRTRWPGTRHARLTIANVLSGDLSTACRHAVSADEWIRHFYRQNDEYRRERVGPERIDIASIPLYFVAQNRARDAALFMKGWKDWYAYEVAEHVFTLLSQARGMETIPAANIHRFLDALKSQPGILAAALSFLDIDGAARRCLIGELAKACKNKLTIETNKDFRRERDYFVQDGLLKAAAIAVAMKLYTEALAITSTAPHERLRLWSFRDRFSNKDAFPYIAFVALRAAAEHQSVVEQTLLPQELVNLGTSAPIGTTGEPFRKALKVELEQYFKSQEGLPDEKRSMSHDTKRDAERFIDGQLEPLIEITQAFTAMLSSGLREGDKAFLHLLDVWTRLRRKRESYSDFHETNSFFDRLGRQLLIFSLWARNDFAVPSVEAFLAKVTEDGVTTASTLVEITGIISKTPRLQESAGKTAITARALIEREGEVGYRASLFAKLSKAIMPASFEETASYFRAGLEQMDAIGSGDYQFTNELLLFAAELKGDELEEADFHTLSNICELNMLSEEEKFPWFAFARGLARTSGCKTLVKLGRWDDRDKISLNYTLLPYLTALIEQDKIDPAIALALLRVSNPAELYDCGTKQLAKVIEQKRYSNSKELVAELILQFEQNHPGVFMPGTVATLSKIAERELGKDTEQSVYLSVAAAKYERLRNEENDQLNYHGAPDPRLAKKADDAKKEDRCALKKIENETDPSDEASMSHAMDALNELRNIFDLKNSFFDSLRKKLKFSERSKYAQVISRLENLDIYTKLEELRKCKEIWGSSSASLGSIFSKIGPLLIQIHADDFVTQDYLSGSKLKEVADLSGIAMPVLALDLIAIFAAPELHLPASIWMGLAAVICEQSKDANGQVALKRLLNSSSAKLASTVVDGVWKEGLYPKGGQTEIAAGLVWLMLGSPSTASRWRAAHSIRCLARFGKWEVVDALVGKLHSTDAHPYQAPELSFYFLHARLWLLLAIARIAMDHPRNVAKYADMMKAIAFDRDVPHVLLRHFAAQALLACVRIGSIVLSDADARALETVNESPFPKKRTKARPYNSFYQSRPTSMPEPHPAFYLDYDFEKYDVTSVSDIFDRSRWETEDAITAWVRKYDQKITSMHENGGRTTRGRERLRGTNSRHHLYGQQLGWHALYLVAGEFLAKYPVVQRPYDDDNSWREWLKRELLTRKDGLWLADGIDRPPLDAQVNLCEKGEKGVVLTGDRRKLLALLNIGTSITENLVVGGDWHSVDNIGIRVTSALIPPRGANKLALHLSREEPFQAWLPCAEEYEAGAEFSRSKNETYKPWIVWPSTEARLDEGDPLGVVSVVRRLHFTKAVNLVASIKTTDPFKRTWTDSEGKLAARSEAWERNRTHDEEEPISGERFICSADFLKNVLVKQRAELLLLVILRRYDKGVRSQESQYWHTTAVIRVKQSLDFEFFRGVVNELHVMKY
ncbi:MAG: NACHT domain-containing protein [Verrucomicrobia bacterium]|nr:NACHT domain-containing protein [Verrucomicrobiota bacterium]MBU4291387.1 NACHT domain-containing protein [Verrucomicrobiota bacterium]MBU4497430.1 NACHT domain-containing protein [Verrucomicrobiota bacterium]MCG2680085.1 NACHT domain-containing protein [Kiritimatiellia bacterium]